MTALAASGGTKIGAGGASYTPTRGINLYAQWTKANYAISSPKTGANTFADAVSLANTTATITLQSEITDPSTTTISNKVLTFNTDGLKVTRTGATYIGTGGSLSITGSGTMVRGSSSSCYQLIHLNGGSLTVGSVTMTNSGSSSCTSSLLKNSGTGTLTINSGASITSSRNTLLLGGTGTITVAGGTVAGTSTYNTIYTNDSSSGGTINITGGTISTTSDADYAIAIGTDATGKTLTISEGL